MNIEVKWTIKSRVYIRELKTVATVIAVYISETGIQYSCRYFDDRSALTAYFYESELSNPPEGDKVGFA